MGYKWFNSWREDTRSSVYSDVYFHLAQQADVTLIPPPSAGSDSGGGNRCLQRCISSGDASEILQVTQHCGRHCRTSRAVCGRAPGGRAGVMAGRVAFSSQHCFLPVWPASQEEKTDRLSSASCWCPPPGQTGSANLPSARPSHNTTGPHCAADNNSLGLCVSTAINVHFTDIKQVIRSLCVVIMSMCLHRAKKWMDVCDPHSKIKRPIFTWLKVETG